MSSVQYEEMRPDEIRKARENCAAAYLPMGILEWHGKHLPVGNDTLKAHKMAIHFAKEIGGLAMPPIWWGDHRAAIAEVVFGPDKFTNLDRDHRPEIAEAYGLDLDRFYEDAERAENDGSWDLFDGVLRNSYFELYTLGFDVVVTISGHYPLRTPADSAAEAFNALDKLRVISITGFELAEGYDGDHAAKWETSMLMNLRPELVDMSKLDDDLTRQPTGVMGEDPRTSASPEYGKAGLDAITATLRGQVKEALGAG